MPTDIVYAKQELIDFAKELGYKNLIVIGDISKLKSNLNLYEAELIEKGKVKHNKKLLIAQAKNEKQNRIIAKKADFVYDLEYQERKDHLHYRRAGVTQVHMKDMKGMIINFKKFLSTKNQILALGRIKQNLTLASKYDVPVIIGTFAKQKTEMRSAHDLKAFLKMLTTKHIKIWRKA